MDKSEVDRAVAILRRDQPAVVESLRRVMSCTMDQDGRVAVNEIFMCILQQTLLLEYKRERAKASFRKQAGLAGAAGYTALNHIPDVLLRIFCDIAEVPHVSNATTEWLDKMENKCH